MKTERATQLRRALDSFDPTGSRIADRVVRRVVQGQLALPPDVVHRVRRRAGTLPAAVVLTATNAERLGSRGVVSPATGGEAEAVVTSAVFAAIHESADGRLEPDLVPEWETLARALTGYLLAEAWDEGRAGLTGSLTGGLTGALSARPAIRVRPANGLAGVRATA